MPLYTNFATWPERATEKRAKLTATSLAEFNNNDKELTIVVYDVATAKRMVISFTAKETKQIDEAINHGIFTEITELPRHWR